MRARTMRPISLISVQGRMFVLHGVRMIVGSRRIHGPDVSVAVICAWHTLRRHRHARGGASTGGR